MAHDFSQILKTTQFELVAVNTRLLIGSVNGFFLELGGIVRERALGVFARISVLRRGPNKHLDCQQLLNTVIIDLIYGNMLLNMIDYDLLFHQINHRSYLITYFRVHFSIFWGWLRR